MANGFLAPRQKTTAQKAGTLARRLANPEISDAQKQRIEARLGFLEDTGRTKEGSTKKATNFVNRYLSKQEQQVRNQQIGQEGQAAGIGQGILDQVESTYSQPYDASGLPSAPNVNDLQGARQKIEDEQYDRYFARIGPQQEQARKEFEARMYSRGLAPGSEGYDRERALFDQAQNDERLQARAQAQSEADSQFQTLFNIGTEARGNQLNEDLLLRGQPLNEYGAISSIYQPSAQASTEYLRNQKQLKDQRRFEARQGKLGRQTAIAQSRIGAAGPDPNNYAGTGMTYGDYLKTRSNQDYQDLGNQLALQRQYQPKGPSVGSQLAGQVGGALVGGISQGIGKQVGKGKGLWDILTGLF